MLLKHLLFAVCVSTFVYMGAWSAEDSTVDTDVGTFTGYIRRFKAFGQDIAVRRFLGIPFAEPPVGELRFQKPVMKAKLETPYDASKHAPSCKQQKMSLGGKRKPGRYDNQKTSEDCLYLNIYTPEKAEKLPVMIYIHGGGFVFGSPTIYAQDILSVYGNVVAVTIAYRLSIWGFLSTGDKELPGNYGLWDQQMAIQWVHGNIEKFGGDPSSVTIYGSSAGGSSVVYQGMYPGNQGLIHRVIAQSGSATCRFAFNKDPLPDASRLGKLVGCSDKTTKQLAECLKSKTSDELWESIHVKENRFTLFPWEFIPVRDNDFLPEPPTDLFYGTSKPSNVYRKAFRDIDLMIGYAESDGLILLTPLFDVPDPDAFEVDYEKYALELVPELLRIYFGNDVPDVLNKVVVGEYTNWDNPSDNTEVMESYVKLGGDFLFAVQTIETAKMHALDSDRNTYVFAYDAFPSQHIFPVPSWATRPTHVDEMSTVLGYDKEDGFASWTTPYSDDPPADWELELSKAHMKMWTNFARTGNPNEPADVSGFVKTVWPTFHTTSESYLRIARNMSEKSVGQRLLAREEHFWLNVLPEIIHAVRGDYWRQGETGKEFCEKDGDCTP